MIIMTMMLMLWQTRWLLRVALTFDVAFWATALMWLGATPDRLFPRPLAYVLVALPLSACCHFRSAPLAAYPPTHAVGAAVRRQARVRGQRRMMRRCDFAALYLPT